MRKFTLLLVSLLLAGAQMLQAQRTITGTVIDATDKMGIPGASVLAKGTTVGTTTDADGRYSLVVPNNVNVLVFQYTGMAKQEIEINGRTAIDVIMQTGDQTLEAVVVTGYGSARKIGNTVGSVQQVTAKKLEGRPSANVMDALQGQVAGLQVFTSSGDPSAYQSIRLHGTGSLNAGTSPLYILDGQPIDASTMLSLNPNDFESITMLKDASATSIYGSRASNGVIVMTTKRGSRNNDARVVLRSQYGISQQASRDFYDNLMNGPEFINFQEELGLINSNLAAQLRSKYPGSTNWLDVFQRNNVPTFQTDLSIQGGGGKTTYFVSGSQFSQQGTAWGSEFERYTLRANIESKAKDWLTLGTNVMLGRDNRRRNSSYDANYYNGGLFYINPPYLPTTDAEGNRLDMLESVGEEMAHPEYEAEKIMNRVTGNQISANFFVEIEPIKNLKIRSRAGTNMNQYLSNYKRYPSYIPALGNGRVYKQNETSLNFSITNTIEYMFNIGKKQQLSLLAGHEGIGKDYSINYANSSGQTDDRLMELEHGNQFNSSSSIVKSRYLSFFGRADYSFDDRIFVDLSIRNDASSRFGKDVRNAIFWAAGAKWIISKEKFMANNRNITNLAFKTTYGTQGNSAFDDYEALAFLGTAIPYNSVIGTMISTPGNPLLTWEKQGKLTIGAEIELNNRWRMNIDYYRRHSTALLMAVPNAPSTGFSELSGNIGGLRNAGVDINLSLDILREADYFLTFSLNFNYNQETITELFKDQSEYIWSSYNYAWVEGARINYYMPLYAGVDPANGRMQWYVPGESIHDITRGDKTYVGDGEDYATTDELLQNTGKPLHAPYNGGFSIGAGWKGISLQADFSVVLGKWLINNDNFFAINPLIGGNQTKDVWDYWTPENTGARFPDWTNGQMMEFDTHLLENASFMRLKNLTLSYSFPQKWMRKTKVFENIRIFVIGRNLFTITNYSGVDPEIDRNLTVGGYVNSRQFAAGLELTF